MPREKRPRPDPERVRDALREHDERVEEPPQAPPPEDENGGATEAPDD